MRLSCTLCWLAMILTANPAGLARAGEAADTNPALLYYRAILSTPEISAELSDADRQLILGSVPELSEAADSTAKLVEAYIPTFRLLRQAASSKARCDWGSGILVDPQTLMPVHTRAKALCHAASFRARYFLEAGRPDDAVADLIAVWALARNLSAHGTLFSVRVRDSMEALLDQFVAEHFHRFSPETLRALAAALDALPGRGSVADAIEPEKQRFVASELRPLVQLRAELSDDDQAVIAQFRERRLREAEASGDWESLDRITAETDKLIAQAGGTAEGLQRAVEVLDCQEFRHDFRRRFLIERSNPAWDLGQFLFTRPRLAWTGVVLIGAALIVVWMLSHGEFAIELAQQENEGMPGASQNFVSATIARIDSQSRPTPTWMYYSDTLSSEALDQLLDREWMRKVLPPPSLDLPGH